MEESTADIKEIHKTELDMLCRCKEICEKYDIPYYLCYGTLLGAVRHKGFIPWDDDIDIMMPAHMIPVFKKHFTEEVGEPYFYSDIYTEPECLEPWAKIRRSDTTSMPEALSKINVNWGICIDIFPLYPLPGSRIMRQLKMIASYVAECLLRSETSKYVRNSSCKSKIISAVPHRFRKAVAGRLVKFLASGDCDSEYVYDGFMTIKRSDISGRDVSALFEGIEFRVPSDSEKYLTDAYGDYMKLPPEEERIGHTGEYGRIIWDTERSYKEYV